MLLSVTVWYSPPSSPKGRKKHRIVKMKFISRIHPNAVAYSMTTLGAGMMNSIFNFYYVKLFLNQYKISEGAFHQAQVR